LQAGVSALTFMYDKS